MLDEFLVAQSTAAIRRRIARVIDRVPGATSLILLFLGHPSRVQTGSQFLLDGYPRSANTLAYFRIQTENPEVQFAHHTHKPSQLRKAVRLEIPSVVLVRNPLDAVKSVVRVNPRAYEVNECLKDYIRFYKTALRLQSNYIQIVKFETVIAQEGGAFSRLVQSFLGIKSVASVDEANQLLGPHLEEVGYDNYVGRSDEISGGNKDIGEESHLKVNFNPKPKLLAEAERLYEKALRNAV